MVVLVSFVSAHPTKEAIFWRQPIVLHDAGSLQEPCCASPRQPGRAGGLWSSEGKGHSFYTCGPTVNTLVGILSSLKQTLLAPGISGAGGTQTTLQEPWCPGLTSQDSVLLAPTPSAGREEEEVSAPEIPEEPAPADVPCGVWLLAQSGHFRAPEN